jgi:signal transduction histidine kinase
MKKIAAPAKEQPSQFVLTSQLLSQIASQGDSGLIPRFIGEKLVFLFWERQKDGRIAGCELASSVFRGRIAGVLTSTWSPVRILTLLDENGAPLAVPPDVAARDWRRPFVAREIAESLPRWEAAAYLTRPDSITAQARTSSLVIWIMVVILFVSVAGGGTMVLSSVYGEMKLAQQKATFVANVSHELKTPLTSLSLFIDLLRRKRPLPQSKKEQYLSLMASETERLTRLINNVLDFSRDTAARRYAMRTVDAAEVTAQIVESQRVRLESRGFRLSIERAAPVAAEHAAYQVAAAHQVHADPEALKQVLLNLLSNAEKYSAKRKEIVVTVSGQEGSVLISVRDRGIGIPEKDRERVFREFYRVDDSLSSGVQGTGLGLTIARRIARDHGGEITCAPRDGGGTDFVVRLPAADEGEAPA